MKSTIIDINQFSFSIGETTILDSISLKIFEDEYLSIIGPNGAGKTTLLKCILRIFTSNHGKISLKGNPLERFSRKELARLMSYVPQSSDTNLPFTVEEFVMMGRYPHLSPFTTFGLQDREAVNKALLLTGTQELAGRRLGTLSGGERQTVYIASALVQGAQIMLLDEPTAFLDPKHEADIHTVLRKIKEDTGITIISVTHNINSAALESDRVVILKEGTVAFQGDAAEIMKDDVLERVYGKPFVFIPHPVTGRMIVVPDSREP